LILAQEISDALIGLFGSKQRSYYNRLDPKLVGDNKTFWKTAKPFFLNKIQGSAAINLLENDFVESDDTRVAEILNDYFVDIPKTLGIAWEEDSTTEDFSSQDTLQATVQRF